MSVESRERMERSELLGQLRIERDGQPPRSSARWLAVIAVALVIAAAGVWFAWGRLAAPVVRTAIARDAAPSGGSGSVLDATGYVTARRQATVAAKITGKVKEVLI